MTKIEVLMKKVTDLQLESEKHIGINDEKAREKLAECMEVQVELINAIKSYQDKDKPTIN